MTKPQSQISQVLWKIAEEFCPRIIIIDGQTQWISTIDNSDFIINRLWLPSSIKILSSKSISQNEFIELIVIENISKLSRIESEAFKHVNVRFVRVPSSVGFEMFFWLQITFLD
jgi:hypothetical protein